MTPQEANEIIHAYMGRGCLIYTASDGFIDSSGSINERLLYSNSLDALVPVWEKLNYSAVEVELRGFACGDKTCVVYQFNRECTSVQIESETIQEAAAIATAKAIKEIEKDS